MKWLAPLYDRVSRIRTIPSEIVFRLARCRFSNAARPNFWVKEAPVQLTRLSLMESMETTD